MKTSHQQTLFIRLIIFLANSYYKLLAYFTQEDYFNRKHLEISFENMTLKIKWYSHDEYIEYKRDLLNEAKDNLSPDEFITFLFNHCRHCNFVIFNCKDDNKFIQFWLGDGKLMADWPMLKTNVLGKYKYAMLGVLNELGIHEVKKDQPTPKRIPYYIFKESYNFKTYEIYFQEYQNEATLFVTTVLTKVYKQNLDDLVFQIQ